jgi:hypothetical protein
MVYEWIELIRSSPKELKIIVQENPSTSIRSRSVWLHETVGYLSETLVVTQKGRDRN